MPVAEQPVAAKLPQAEAELVPGARFGGRVLPNTAVCVALSFLLIALAGELEIAAPSVASVLATGGALCFGFSTLLALWRGLRGVVDLFLPELGRTSTGPVPATLAILGNLLMASFGAFVAFFATFGFSRGRQLRRRGRVLLPELRPSPEWTASAAVLAGAQGLPTGLADQWRENGKTEHASVAAFARLTLDLMALGAPPKLIVAANQDALDEIRHAQLCFSLASALDGQRMSPAPFPEAQRVATLPRSRTLALAKLAVDSLVDGALHEGVSARIIARLARCCEVPAIQAALKEIAADEGRHAAHAWAVVEWCLVEGGLAVGQALMGATRALPKQMRSRLPEPAANGGWERWGIHGHEIETQEYSAARAQVIQRAKALAAKRPRKAA